MAIKRRRVQPEPKQPKKPAPADPNSPSASASTEHELAEDVFNEASDGSKPLNDSQRFFITLAVVAVLFALIFAVLQSV